MINGLVCMYKSGSILFGIEYTHIRLIAVYLIPIYFVNHQITNAYNIFINHLFDSHFYIILKITFSNFKYKFKNKYFDIKNLNYIKNVFMYCKTVYNY